MEYCRSIIMKGDVASLEPRVREALKAQGFGVLTEIDVQATLKTKINADIAPYKILGACNPHMAKGALDLEPRIGVMLPCNVILRAQGDGKVEVSAIDPVASMAAIDNPALMEHAALVKGLMDKVLDELDK